MNIYDIAGNVWEWTLEKASDIGGSCAIRGGRFALTGSDIYASYRYYTSTEHSNNDVGFRVSIF